MKITAKNIRGCGLSTTTMFSSHDTFKSLVLQIGTIPGMFGLGLIGPIVIISRAGALTWLSLAIENQLEKI